MKKTLNDTKNSTDGYISEFSLIQSLLHYSTTVGNCVLEPGEDLNIKEILDRMFSNEFSCKIFSITLSLI